MFLHVQTSVICVNPYEMKATGNTLLILMCKGNRILIIEGNSSSSFFSQHIIG